MTWLLYGVGILCLSGVLHVLLKRFFFQLLKRVLAQSIPHVIDRLNDFKVIKALTQMAPFIVTYVVIRYYPPRGIGESTLQLLGSIINIGLIIMVLKFIYSVVALILHQLGGHYPNAKTLTRSVAQVIKIIACVTGAIIVFSIASFFQYLENNAFLNVFFSIKIFHFVEFIINFRHNIFWY
ncbi:MAG: hypothetical protein ACO3K7_06925, partial [Candidatus Marinamargulisbacteria bacterium]